MLRFSLWPRRRLPVPTGRALPSEVRANVRSVTDVPRALLPVGAARARLERLAACGEDVYCYQSGGSRGAWCVWLADRRVTVADYVATFGREGGAA